MMDDAVQDLLAMAHDGSLRPVLGGRYPLTAVREAHQDIRSRRTTGKLVLDPAR
jgi:NADPH2:quinone reductase